MLIREQAAVFHLRSRVAACFDVTPAVNVSSSRSLEKNRVGFAGIARVIHYSSERAREQEFRPLFIRARWIRCNNRTADANER